MRSKNRVLWQRLWGRREELSGCPHTGGEEPVMAGGRMMMRKVINGQGWLGCCHAGEGGRAILGAICSLEAFKEGVCRQSQGWKAPAAGQQVLLLLRWGCHSLEGQHWKAADVCSR